MTRLFVRWRTERDRRARDTLVVRFLPLARQLARRYAGRGAPLEDLTQVASLGLLKAVDRFDVQRGLAFTSFAVPTIVGELKRYFRDCTWAARVPRSEQERVLRLERCERELFAQRGRAPTVSELARAAGLGVEETLDGLQAARAYAPVALDAPGDPDDDADGVLDRVGVEDRRFGLIDEVDWMGPVLRTLSERDRLVLRLRFEEELKQSEIAERIGVSQMQVSRILRRVSERLQILAATHRG